ncbi:MAG: hypothetical protein V4751_12815 [Pseudomonadota bacterium]
MAVNELQRQAYLRELGIQCYFPKRPLPGAKPSRLFGASVLTPVAALTSVAMAPKPSMSAAAALAVVTTSAKAVDVISVPQAEPLRKPLAAPPVVTSVPVAAPMPVASPVSAIAAKPVSAAASSASAAVRFAFAYFPVSPELAVISELPWAKSAAVSAACRQLLVGMLRALNMPHDDRALTSMVFTWPLMEGPDIDQGEESARQTLVGFLARRLKLRPVRYLLVLAEQATGFLFPADFDWQQGRGELLRHPQFPIEMVVTRSLNAMDAVPELKREVWQAMQPLRLALANPAGGIAPSSDNQ